MFIFQFLNEKINNYVKQNIIVHFIIPKLKNMHTFLKNIQTEKAEESLILTEQEETKTKYFAPYKSDTELFLPKMNIQIMCLINTLRVETSMFML